MKFISWNALYIDFIMKAFPGVPAIFLYRDPVEIIASVRKSATAILEAKERKQAEFLSGLSRREIDRIGPTEYLARCYRRSFETVTTWRDRGLALLDYTELTRERFPAILARSFDYRPDSRSIEVMKEQFTTYSKDDGDKVSFSDDRRAKQEMISREDHHLISGVAESALNELRRDLRNLFEPSSLATDVKELAESRMP